MKALIFIYYSKIAFTLVAWCLPLLFFPNLLLTAFDIQEPVVSYFLRLLGWAYLALCVGYFVGLVNAKKGVLLFPPIWAGIVSNSGAAMLLFMLASNYYSQLPWQLTAFIFVSSTGAAFVTYILIYFGLVKRQKSEANLESS